MSTIVFYHANCIDGFTAAWCFHRANTRASGARGQYTLVPLNYGDWEKTRKLIELRPEDEVIFVDVSISPSDVSRLSHEVAKIAILDHHKTARDAWYTSDIEAHETMAQERVCAHFDLTKSGARLAWEYLFPDEAAPDLVRYVEDRDLWKKELEHSEEINAYIGAQPYTFPAYDEMHGAFRVEGLQFAIFGGTAILLSRQKVIDEVLRRAEDFELCGVNVKAVNYGATHGLSEIGHELAKLSRDGCGLIYSIEGEFVRCSLRGHNGRDVSKIASLFGGGGGHPGAAGFRVALQKWITEFNPPTRSFVHP